jgi:hypothetical protein
MRSRRPLLVAGATATTLALTLSGVSSASTPGTDTRLSNDAPTTAGYVSDYALVTGDLSYDAHDPAIRECSRARGRQNEPSVAVNPRDTRVVVGSSNDYCPTYDDGEDEFGAPIPSGPIWLGYYRSTDGGATFRSSLVPGYPGDATPYASRARVRTASAGDPVFAWDKHGRLFAGSESSDDPAGSKKTFGDVWVATFENPEGTSGPTLRDGLEFKRSLVVGKGTSAPNLLGKFNDKTSIEVDRTNTSCEGNVYFAWSVFVGNGGSNIYFSRSTDHGVTFSHPMLLTTVDNDVQDPDIAVTGNGHVYVTYSAFLTRGQTSTDAARYVKSVDCGATFSPARTLVTYQSYDAQDISGESEAPPQTSPDDPDTGEASEEVAGDARDCGDFAAECESGYTFFRRTTSPRTSADQNDTAHEYLYTVYEPVIPGTEVATGTTYGAIESGIGGQSGVYFVRLNGATGARTTPKLVDPTDYLNHQGHQLFADIDADNGTLHVLWWDSRNDPVYSPKRPVGNDADGNGYPSLDVYATMSSDRGATFAGSTRLTDVTSNPNYEQFGGRTVPFAGDYLWIDAATDPAGNSLTYGTWTDYRNTVAGVDQREAGDDDTDGADVLQCRTVTDSGAFTGDTCPRAGGLDQDIYGDRAP